MEVGMPAVLQLVELFVICFALAVQGSTESNISPSPATFSSVPLIEGTPGPAHHRKSWGSSAPISSSQPNGSDSHPPLALPPLTSAPVPRGTQGLVPSLTPSTPAVSPLHQAAPPPSAVQGHVPSMPPSDPQRKTPINKTPVSLPVAAPVPVATPSNLPQNSPVIHPSMPGTLSPSSHHRKAPDNKAPIPEPITPVSAASPPRKFGRYPPAIHPNVPEIAPSTLPAPIASPTSELPQNSPPLHPVMPSESPSILTDPDVSPASTPPPSIVGWHRDRTQEAPPPHETLKPLPLVDHSPAQGPFPAVAPSTHRAMRHSDYAPAPSLLSPKSPLNKGYHSPATSPSTSFYKHHHARNNITSPAPAPSYLVSPPTSKRQGPVISPALLPTSGRTHFAPPPLKPGSSVSQSHFPSPSPMSNASPASSPPPRAAPGPTKMPFLPPIVSPSGSTSKSPKIPLLPPLQAFPPPPPNEDCSSTICTEPYTNTPPGSPCGCVLPMQVGLRLSIALYTFFPLVAELAKETAAGVFMKQSQVHIIGANAASEQPEKTVVLIDLVPLGEKFDNTTALLTFQRFWHKQVVIQASYFGDYEVLYVRYPGLPPSPPSPSGITITDGGPYSGVDSNARTNKPLGVDVHKRWHKDGLGGGIIAIIVISAFVAVVLCSAAALVFIFKRRNLVCDPVPTPRALPSSHNKPSGLGGSLIGSRPSSVSLSFGSSIATYTGSAKTFSTSDIEKATDNFDASRILGEGGFGLVYSGVLEDGTKVAVKVLKRDDQQGGREFLAEVEMLSRLHHRNLVKLIGICTEERSRCLVYELIPNGSVESHLHGIDKEAAPLDWAARMKIALGAARGLAYLHEDSSPRVIHRDFKSSNILLEHDFTPKVSDFGLARTAMDEESRHISTRVMGTFGYVAPEYAMTGHLLVKSDVYSYGVVLLELLSGRKPVDMSQPPGQENLVAWARPLLTSKEGLETIVDQSLGSDVPFDSVAKVAAIASMCVQPEVSHRPFMGEVVQALKLVCNECDEAKVGSRSLSQEDLSICMDAGVSTGSGELPDTVQSQYSLPNFNSAIDTERGMSVSDLFSSSARFGRQASGSFRRHSSSGPLRMGTGRFFWQRIRRSSGGTVSEHGVMFRLWPGSH
ncbi:hypothetical protein FH972_003081 [Carpinus fangiana]|uniref:Protein kinase domain-containing protein n=1 Tax=Carpinus fangiana TaxID=176857 RepID=A0A5N6QHE4_9ROSI|nr:hypothetical protein FH972_003081 [Carpinus fangiana]